MEFTAGTLENKMKGLSTVLQAKGLDNMASYGFSRMAASIETEYRTFEAARKKLILAHAKIGDDGLPELTEEGEAVILDTAAWVQAFGELSDEVISVNVQPVLMSLIVESEGHVSGGTMIQLGELIEDDMEEKSQAPLKIVDAE